MGVDQAAGPAVARAKLLLLGEHAAVYGHPAIGLSLPWPLTVVRTPAPGWELPGLGGYEAAVRGLLAWLIDEAAREGLPPPPPGRLVFATEVPVASGFGSSGALCAALVNLFFPQLPLNERDRLAWRAEGLFHGTPSGIDTALALREGWWALDPSTRPAAARSLTDRQWTLVVGSLVRQSDTKTLVASLGARRASGEEEVITTLDELGSLAAQAIAQWDELDAPALGTLVNRARTGLRRLGLETPGLTAVLEAGLARPGALAGKLSGAGGGGAFLLLFTDRTSARAALDDIVRAVAPEQWSTPPRLL